MRSWRAQLFSAFEMVKSRRISQPISRQVTASNEELGPDAPDDLRKVMSRREISVATVSMNGRNVLGAVPRYKLDLLENYLAALPDVLFMQDTFDEADVSKVLDKVSTNKYQYYFQSCDANDGEEASDKPKSATTGLAWNKTKYIGTPLQLDDLRLKQYTSWLKNNDITIVKLDSRERHSTEHLYPSFVAVSWQGPGYNSALKTRIQVCKQLLAFITTLRKNNLNIAVIIGGDFNMDMKSFDLAAYSDFLLVPYRPVSGSLAKDLKNTFMFTLDCIQVTETAFKQFHPDIFANPFIRIKVRGKHTLKLWAIVVIQRAVRRMLQRSRAKRAGLRQLSESKKRWRRKIEGDDYSSDTESELPKAAPLPAVPKPKPQPPPEVQTEPRFKEESKEGSRSLSDDFYSKPMEVPMPNHRRKKYSELKSVQERKKELAVNSFLYR